MKKQEKNSIVEYVWLFIFGCFLGFILETIWHYLKYGTFINKQGLLYGPFKPIYGFGFILIIIFMSKYQNKGLFKQFIIGVLIGSLFEYFGSWFQEFFFGTSTWNYSHFNYNIQGRIYLPYCLAWGVIAVLCLNFLYPWFKKLINEIPARVGKVLTIFVSIFMCLNISLTTLATIRYSDRANSKTRTSPIFKVIDELYDDEYMQLKFPKLKVIKK
ncbi:MAG: putative ABC transporter permease [Bacilli bacterium]|nr:putative ABC transporter permease [Bacilli bacterium]